VEKKWTSSRYLEIGTRKHFPKKSLWGVRKLDYEECGAWISTREKLKAAEKAGRKRSAEGRGERGSPPYESKS